MTSPIDNPGPWRNDRRPGRRGFPKRIARQILANHPTCALAFPGCTITATEVDHIVGFSDATALGWDPATIDDPANAQPACTQCHARKTAAEAAAGRARAKQSRRTRRRRRDQRHPGLTD